jgi:cobalt-zinc-cadmium resistance protein CzcA
VVTGVAMMLIGQNSRVVSQRIGEELKQIQKTLPPGVKIDNYYDRTDLVQKTIQTVRKNLLEGAILVIAVLLLLLGNVQGSLIVAAAIPLSMLVAFTGMVSAGISGNLMSLGAIDFGLIVDGSVVMVENIVRRLSERKDEAPTYADSRQMWGTQTMATILEAAREVARPVFFAVLIIIVVYVPVLTLEGVEGKMFRPMAWTVIFALIASLVFALTLMPVLSSFLLRKGVKNGESRAIRVVSLRYKPWLQAFLRHPGRTASIAGGLLAVGVIVVLFMGAEFIPRLDEGTLAIQAARLPSVSLTDAIRTSTLTENVLRRFPEAVRPG